jgi:hypothetical protein
MLITMTMTTAISATITTVTEYQWVPALTKKEVQCESNVFYLG